MLGEILKRLFSKESERRRERREDVSLGTVTVDGRTFPVRNWSSTGFLAAPYAGDYKEGDSVDIRFEVQVPGRSINFACKAILIRVDLKAQELAGVFTMMDRESRILVARHFE